MLKHLKSLHKISKPKLTKRISTLLTVNSTQDNIIVLCLTCILKSIYKRKIVGIFNVFKINIILQLYKINCL